MLTIKKLLYVVLPESEVTLVDMNEKVIVQGPLKVIMDDIWTKVESNIEVNSISSWYSNNGNTSLKIQLVT